MKKYLITYTSSTSYLIIRILAALDTYNVKILKTLIAIRDLHKENLKPAIYIASCVSNIKFEAMEKTKYSKNDRVYILLFIANYDL